MSRGHDVVTPTFPCRRRHRRTAGLRRRRGGEPSATVGDLVLVAQSLAGFVAPLVCDQVPVDLMVLVAAMVPRPGETGAAWWTNTGHADARGPDASDDPVVTFLHDVPPDVAAESAAHVPAPSRGPSSTSAGRSRRGPTCRPASSSAVTTGSSPPTSSAGWCASASASCRTRWAADTSPPWRTRGSSRTASWRTPRLPERRRALAVVSAP